MTLRGVALFVAMAALAAVPLAATDPALMKLVPSDATVVAGMNLEQARMSPFGQYVLKQVPMEDEDVRKLMEATGFDPRRDLREILVASAGGPAAARGKGIVLATGSFDPARIVAMARTMGAAVTTYAGVDVLGGKEPKSAWLALLDRSLAVAGDPDQVKAAIDRYQKGGAGPGASISAKATEWSNRADAWVVSTGSPTSWTSHVPAPQAAGPLQGVSLDAIEQSAGGVKFGAVVKISVEAVARTDKDAAALGDVVRFVAGMAQLNRDKKVPDQLAAFLDTMDLKTEARTVTLSFSMPQEQLEKLIQSGPEKRKSAPRAKATI